MGKALQNRQKNIENYIRKDIYLISMPLKYLVREIIINKKFARTQQISWIDKKRLIHSIINGINNKNLFLAKDKENENYNLWTSQNEPYSLSIYYSLEPKIIIKAKILSEDETSINEGVEYNEQSYLSNTAIFLFNICYIKHKDL